MKNVAGIVTLLMGVVIFLGAFNSDNTEDNVVVIAFWGGLIVAYTGYRVLKSPDSR